TYIKLGEQEPGVSIRRLSAVPDDPRFTKGLFVQPVIFTGIANDHRVAREEIFGPLTCVSTTKNYEEVIEQANDCDFGLAATIWIKKLKVDMYETQRLQADLDQVNQNFVAQPELSHGGIKLSYLVKEASLEAMLEHFTQKK